MRKPTLLIAMVLVSVLTGTAIGKIVRAKPIRHNLQAVEVPRRHYNKLATIQLAGALGLTVGLFFPPLGILTGICLMLYFGGAVLAHIRTKDPNVVPAGFFAILSGVVAGRLLDEHRRYTEQRRSGGAVTSAPSPSSNGFVHGSGGMGSSRNTNLN